LTNSQPVILRHVPDGFLDCPAPKLKEILPGPCLFDLKGRDKRPLFVSALLHGNEDAGLKAVQTVLQRYAQRDLPRSMLLYIGNVEAAAANLRTLPEQLDFNRVWPGTLVPDHPQARMAQQIFDYAERRGLFASVDIHNNTGFNPHYACISRLEPHFIALAQLFSRIVVHFERPVGTHARAFARLCPAITVECGKAGGDTGAAHAAELVDACLSLAQFPSHAPAPHDVDLLRTYAIVKTPPEASFSFDGSPADFRFRSDLDQLNFSELAAGASFGSLGSAGARLDIQPGEGEATAPEECFDYSDGEIRLIKSAIPAMLTLDPRAVRLDCLCYLMHRIDMSGHMI
jgi:succinylglutamate desuccinylase